MEVSAGKIPAWDVMIWGSSGERKAGTSGCGHQRSWQGDSVKMTSASSKKYILSEEYWPHLPEHPLPGRTNQ